MSTENVAMVERWFAEVWNQKRAETIDELLSNDSVCHAESGTLHGRDAFKAMHNTFVSAFPDVKMTVEAIVSEGDQVVVRWLFSGTHHGDHLGFPANGEKASFRGMTWIRFHEGRMVEGWDCWNFGGLMDRLQRSERG